MKRLSKNQDILVELAKLDEFFESPTINCWSKTEDGLRIFIFSSLCVNSDEILNSYAEVRDHVAITFQSQFLEDDAERWNVYIFFFVREKVSDSVKQLIEQDKFSTRKIVIDNIQQEINDEYVKSLIYQEIFDFEVEKRDVNQEPIMNVIQKNNPIVYDFLYGLGGNGEKNLDDFINSLS